MKAAVAYDDISVPADVRAELLEESKVEHDARDVFLEQLVYLADGTRKATLTEELHSLRFLLRRSNFNGGAP